MFKKSRNGIMFSLGFLALIGLAGCARYKAQPLKTLSPIASPYIKTRFVSFSHRFFTKTDCMTYLDRDVLAKGYQPIHISIVNNSNRPLCISRNSFSFPYVQAQEVAKKVHTSTAGRVVGYGIGGLFIWPLLIPAVVDGIGSSEANAELDADFEHKLICEQQIAPFSTLNGIVFTPIKSVKDNFSITLTDAENNEPIVLSTGRPRIEMKS